MYAVIETGGKQYRVEVGTELEVELLDVEPGKTITIDRVLLVADGDESTIGRPLVADASVSAEVVNQTRGPKLISFKYRPKARSRVKKGHRQELTVLRIADITLGGKSAAKSAGEGRGRREDRADASRGGRRRAGRQGRRARREARGQGRGPSPPSRPGPRRRRRPRPRRPPSPRRRPRPRRRRPPRPTRRDRRGTGEEAGGPEEGGRQGGRHGRRPAPPTKRRRGPKKPRATKKDE